MGLQNVSIPMLFLAFFEVVWVFFMCKTIKGNTLSSLSYRNKEVYFAVNSKKFERSLLQFDPNFGVPSLI